MSRSEATGRAPSLRRTNAERAGETRALLISVARDLFAERGYAAVATEEIVQRAGLTRGALYHHFRDKRALFRAVVEQLEEESVERIASSAMEQPEPWGMQITALNAYLDGCLDPAVQRILLVDAPSVLGSEEWREIEAKYGLALVRMGLEAVMQAGLIAEQPVEPLAHLMLGALAEAGLMIARSEDPQKARQEVGESVERLLEGLRLTR
jgi:AcrR family transcriptional regulator